MRFFRSENCAFLSLFFFFFDAEKSRFVKSTYPKNNGIIPGHLTYFNALLVSLFLYRFIWLFNPPSRHTVSIRVSSSKL